MFGRKHRIRVDHIINGIVHKKKLEDQDNKVVVKKDRGVRGKPNTYAKYDKDCVIYYQAGVWPFRKLKPKLILKDDHVECVRFHEKKVNISGPDPTEVFDVGAFKNAGATLQTIKAPSVMYIGFAAIIFMQILTLLFATGKVRIV